MRIATWNINSVRLRIDLVKRLAEERSPDIICLQETKVADHLFPREALAEMGYPHQAFAGQKGYHGVAILARNPLENLGKRDFCGKGDARHIAVKLPGGAILHNFYIPAGGDEPDREINEKFGHKLDFVDEMTAWFGDPKKSDPMLSSRMILVGDFNIAPAENDVWSHKQLLKVVSHTPIEVEKLTALMAAGRFTDVSRHFAPEPEKLYSWWSYRARDWAASDRGRRLDHIWVSPELKPALRAQEILREARGWPPKPSDHCPVIVDIDA